MADTWMDQESNADIPMTYGELIRQSVFIGEYTVETIQEAIQAQFEDYIDLQDQHNYVDQFFQQWAASLLHSQTSEEEAHPDEAREVLETIRDEFLSFLQEQFETRLALTFDDLDETRIDYDVIIPILRKAYAFFILGARSNFTNIITRTVGPKVRTIEEDDLYWTTLEAELKEFSPLVKCLTPTEFLQALDEEVYTLFEQGYMVGNFLTKYSPKLYQKEEFKIEIMNNVTASIAVQEEVFGSAGSEN